MTPGQRAAAALTALILACLTGWAAIAGTGWVIWQFLLFLMGAAA